VSTLKIEHKYNDKLTGVWAQMIEDSIPVGGGPRLSTMVVRLPRVVLAEWNTHRAFSRGSASSRAIPAKTFRERVLANPYIPWRWPVNGKGMVPASYVDRQSCPQATGAEEDWLNALDEMVERHKTMELLGIHKEVTNRLLEPWMFTEVLTTGTEWDNFFNQRCHPAAQDGIRAGAECVRDLRARSVPVEQNMHLPYITAEERASGVHWTVLMLASARRCRRVSYMNQGVAVPLLEDAVAGLSGLEEMPPHLSPYEHMARARSRSDMRYANFFCWQSLRHMVETEHVLPLVKKYLQSAQEAAR
jgi:thymidylate synthase ThyX